MEGDHNNPHLHHYYQNHQCHLLPWQQQQQQQPWLDGNVDPSLSSSSAANRSPQWSFQETKDFLMIRDYLDLAFLVMKRNKFLWEVVSSKMREKGYHRSAEQCKCKWKNLCTRYKGFGKSNFEEVGQQFPFFNDMQEIIGMRMHRMELAEEEGGTRSSSRKKPTTATFSSEDEEEEEEEDSEEEKGKKMKQVKSGIGSGSGGNGEVRSLLEEFMKQQLDLEVQWKEALEARECERKGKEMEWRQKMEELEKEQMVMNQMWREREVQRITWEKARAEKRDVLVAALLNKLDKSE